MISELVGEFGKNGKLTYQSACHKGPTNQQSRRLLVPWILRWIERRAMLKFGLDLHWQHLPNLSQY